jgi:hypothetical protein
MSHTAEITLGERTGKRVVVVCGECGRPTEHEVLVDVDSYDKTPDDEIRFWDNYLTIQCRGCKTLSFCIESSNTEDINPAGGSTHHDEDFVPRQDSRTPSTARSPLPALGPAKGV